MSLFSPWVFVDFLQRIWPDVLRQEFLTLKSFFSVLRPLSNFLLPSHRPAGKKSTIFASLSLPERGFSGNVRDDSGSTLSLGALPAPLQVRQRQQKSPLWQLGCKKLDSYPSIHPPGAGPEALSCSHPRLCLGPAPEHKDVEVGEEIIRWVRGNQGLI